MRNGRLYRIPVRQFTAANTRIEDERLRDRQRQLLSTGVPRLELAGPAPEETAEPPVRRSRRGARVHGQVRGAEVSANTGRLGDAIERLLPFIIVVVIVTFAFFWFIQAPLNAYLRTRTDTDALQARLKTEQESVARASGTPPVDIQATLAAFERQMSPDEKVADVTALLAKAVLDSAPGDKLRGFVIETSDRIKAENDEGGGARAAAVSADRVASAPDPRLALFPYTVVYTPVKVAFSSTFEGIANFMWKVRDLPTTVEVRSATLTRGLPFMKMELLIWVYQRGAAVGPDPAPIPGGPSGGAGDRRRSCWRVARLTGAEG